MSNSPTTDRQQFSPTHSFFNSSSVTRLPQIPELHTLVLLVQHPAFQRPATLLVPAARPLTTCDIHTSFCCKLSLKILCQNREPSFHTSSPCLQLFILASSVIGTPYNAPSEPLLNLKIFHSVWSSNRVHKNTQLPGYHPIVPNS